MAHSLLVNFCRIHEDQEPMANLIVSYLLPVDGLPEVRVVTDYLFQTARLEMSGRVVLETQDQSKLIEGVHCDIGGVDVEMRLRPQEHKIHLFANGAEAMPVDSLGMRPTRSAWLHAIQALAGSGAGFVASWLYLEKASFLHSEWALKMGQHTLGWHLLLTLTLFPASVWGQRPGIRAVQFVSLVFFLIHAGMAIANVGRQDIATPYDSWIAIFNALSGVFFAVATAYGQRAYRDMDPVLAARRES